MSKFGNFRQVCRHKYMYIYIYIFFSFLCVAHIICIYIYIYTSISHRSVRWFLRHSPSGVCSPGHAPLAPWACSPGRAPLAVLPLPCSLGRASLAVLPWTWLVWTNLVWTCLVWTNVDEFGRIWTNSDELESIWTSLDEFRQLRTNWMSFDEFGRFRTNPDKLARIPGQNPDKIVDTIATILSCCKSASCMTISLSLLSNRLSLVCKCRRMGRGTKGSTCLLYGSIWVPLPGVIMGVLGPFWVHSAYLGAIWAILHQKASHQLHQKAAPRLPLL